MDTSEKTYEISGGGKSEHVAQEGGTTRLKEVIEIPNMAPLKTSMFWRYNGNTTVFADKSATKHVEAWGPGVGKVIYVDNPAFSTPGNVGNIMLDNSLLTQRLTQWKELNQFSFWAGCLILLVLNYGVLLRAKILPDIKLFS